MNVVVITSSPHKNGTTATLADAFIEGATKAGHDIFRFDAGRAKLSPCLACNHCRSPRGNGACVHDDGMKDLFPALEAADVVALVTPLYYFGMSAQLKTVIDRFYSRNAVLRAQAKKTLLIAAAYDDQDWTMAALTSHYTTVAKYMNWQDAGMLLATGCGCREDLAKTDFLQKAREMGRTLSA